MYKRREAIRKIRTQLENGNLLGKAIACTKVKCYQTIQNWREKPAKFSKYWHIRCDKLLSICQEKSENKRVDSVEDKQLSRLLAGNASAAEYIFYLCNRRPEKWKNDYKVIHSGKIDSDTKIDITIKRMKDSEIDFALESILNRRKITPICSN